MRILKKLLYILLAIIGLAAAIGLSYIGGYIVRWFVWLICFIWELIGGQNTVTIWINHHDQAMHIICSFVVLPLLVFFVISGGTKDSSLSSASDTGSNERNYNYIDDLNDIKRHQFSFVDASGAFRRWGDDFIDCKENCCSWGSGFYDYDGNYIRWGSTFKDSSGAYRRWGDDFVDGAGHWVTNLPQ